MSTSVITQRDTSFPVRGPDVGGAVRGYSLHLDRSGRPVPGTLRDITTYSPSFGWAAGNAVSNAREVARFYGALLRGRLLKPELLREALRTVPTGPPGRAYGLGLNVRDSPFGPLAGPDGDIPGFSIQARALTDAIRPSLRSTRTSPLTRLKTRSTTRSTPPWRRRSLRATAAHGARERRSDPEA